MNKQELLNERGKILQDMTLLGEMRSGTISERYQKCSTKNCHCKTKGDRGHGPIYALSYYDDNGKLHSLNMKPGKQLDLIRSHIDNYHRYKELSKRFIRVNNELSRIQELTIQDPMSLKKNSSRKSASLHKPK